jgi:hypothetical protein
MKTNTLFYGLRYDTASKLLGYTAPNLRADVNDALEGFGRKKYLSNRGAVPPGGTEENYEKTLVRIASVPDEIRT